MKFCQICRESYYPDDSFCPQCHGGQDTEEAPLRIIELVDDTNAGETEYGKIRKGKTSELSITGQKPVTLNNIKKIEKRHNAHIVFFQNKDDTIPLHTWSFKDDTLANNTWNDLVQKLVSINYCESHLRQQVQDYEEKLEQIYKLANECHPQLRQWTIDQILVIAR
jgi:hypothetical protein